MFDYWILLLNCIEEGCIYVIFDFGIITSQATRAAITIMIITFFIAVMISVSVLGFTTLSLRFNYNFFFTTRIGAVGM
jgi:hypothetical protein